MPRLWADSARQKNFEVSNCITHMDELGYYTIALVLYVMVFGLVGWVIGERKGRPEAGFLFGALLGPIGWLVVAVGPDIKAQHTVTRMKKCPYCAELVQPDAKLCKHCGKDIPTLSANYFHLSANYFYERKHQQPKQTFSSSDVKYYFSTDTEQHQGPVDESDLKLMRQEDIITDDALIICEGESEWRSYRDYFAQDK
jgi:hypothetical protein